MDQRTEQWLAWRREGIAASDAPIVMGVSPYSTIVDLWRDKRGLPPLKPKSTFIMDRGNHLEPIARARYSLLTGNTMLPALYQHHEHKLFRASMDGANPSMKGGLEIKYVGKKDFDDICGDMVPVRYYPQVQAQLFVTGFEWIDFFAYYLTPECLKDPELHHRGKSKTIRIRPDLPFIERFVEEGYKFWKYVQDGVEPPYTPPPKKTRRKKDAEQAAEPVTP